MRKLRLVLFLLFAPAGYAQEQGRLTGSVVDGSGLPVPAATVQLFIPGGKTSLFRGQTTREGLFRLVDIRPGKYRLAIDAAGFAPVGIAEVAIDPGRETALPEIRLHLGAMAQAMDVQTDSAALVQTANAEVTSTLTSEQMHQLPQRDRSPLALISTQAGVGSNGLENTTINGQRTSFANVTFAGINVQDNYIRSNALDYLPNLLLEDEVSEVTITTSNSNPALGAGSAQIAFAPPSGTNAFRGSLYWYNRNSDAAANDWFSNQSGVQRAFLNQNQVGGSLGGYILKNKLFFYGNYEAYRQRQQMNQLRTVYTASALAGVYSYRNRTTRQVQTINVLAIAGLGPDPTIAAILAQIPRNFNSFDAGDSSASLLRNTAGYRFLQQNNRDRNNALGNFDYYAAKKHSFNFAYKWNNDRLDRPDLDNTFLATPLVSNQVHANLLSAGWRWTPLPSLTNELRGGFNLAPGQFATSRTPAVIYAGLASDNPVNAYRPQGRDTRTFALNDNANYTRGRHNLQFGYQSQFVRVHEYDYTGTTPTYNLGISGRNPVGLTAAQLPGGNAADVAGANALLAVLSGQISSASQTFNLTGRTTGFMAGAPNIRDLTSDLFSFYAQDNWKLRHGVTLNLGVRYEYFTPVNEQNGLALLPRLENGNAISTILNPNAVLDFAGGNTGRGLYKKDLNNFAPNAGLAWDVFGHGKTAIRAGYSINFVNDEFLRAAENSALDTNAGLTSLVTRSGLSATPSTLPTLALPTLQIPRTTASNYALDTTNLVGLPDPNLVTPYVQQWNFSIQQQIDRFVLDARYVGNHGTKLFRAIDFNQVIIKQNGFLADFQKAQRNAALANGNPAYNAAIPGSQQLPVFGQLRNAQLNNATVRGYVATGEVGALAELYATNGNNGSVQFFPNPAAVAADVLTNYSNSSYNALQVDLTRRFNAGLSVQANYTYSKVLSDSAGDGQSRFEPFLDAGNASLERSRAPFDQSQVFKANYIYDLPFGKGRRFNLGHVGNLLLGGFTTSGILTWSSGNPFSFYSGYATLNRAGGNRSINNTAVTALTAGQIDRLIGLRFDGNGAYTVSASTINSTDGTGLGTVFSNPVAGAVGNLSKYQFNGPSWVAFDAGVQRKIKLTERITAELRAEAINVLNHPTFFVGDQNINSNTFGVISASQTPPRVIQAALYLRF